jgi:hypothetical protein
MPGLNGRIIYLNSKPISISLPYQIWDRQRGLHEDVRHKRYGMYAVAAGYV